MVEVKVLVLNRIAARGLGRRIDRVSGIRIHGLAIGPEIDRADMQRLVKIADEVDQQHQRFLLVLDRKRRRRRLVLQHRDGSSDDGDHIVIVGALESTVEPALQYRNILEVEHRMARAFDTVAFPIPLRVIDDPRSLAY